MIKLTYLVNQEKSENTFTKTYNKVRQNQILILIDDFNTRIRNDPITGMKRRLFNKQTYNDN